MGKDVEYIPVHLVKDGGEQKQDAYTKINPSQVSPLLETRAYRLVNFSFWRPFAPRFICANLFLLSVDGPHPNHERQGPDEEARVPC